MARSALHPFRGRFAAAAEPALLARAAAFTRSTGTWLHMTYGLRVQPGSLRYHNSSVLVSPHGARVWTYRKSFPVPGYEQRNMLPGDGRVARAATPFGVLAGAICYDADHEATMRQADADLLILPSDDWPAIVDLHARMVTLRSIEYGVPILRPAINGRSLLVDARGRTVVALPVGPGQTARARLGTRADPTIYRAIGDAFAWASLALLAALLIAAVRRRGHLPPSPPASWRRSASSVSWTNSRRQ